MDNLNPCPDCGLPPVLHPTKNVYGFTCGTTIECRNHPLLEWRFAYNEVAWNRLEPGVSLP
jgi:hypothetical protein